MGAMIKNSSEEKGWIRFILSRVDLLHLCVTLLCEQLSAFLIELEDVEGDVGDEHVCLVM